MTKLISFAGVSKVNGVLKFRGANHQSRITQLQKLGDTEVEMRYLGRDMTKSQAAKELLAMNFANGRADIDALLVSVAKDDNPFVKPKKTRTVKVKSTKGDPVEAYFLAVEADEVKLTPKQAAKVRAEFCERVRQAYEAN
jgi:hypothetical protein